MFYVQDANRDITPAPCQDDEASCTEKESYKGDFL